MPVIKNNDRGPAFVHHPLRRPGSGRGPGVDLSLVSLGGGAPSGRRAEARWPEVPPHSAKTNDKSTPGPQPDPGRRKGGVQKSGPDIIRSNGDAQPISRTELRKLGTTNSARKGKGKSDLRPICESIISIGCARLVVLRWSEPPASYNNQELLGHP
jgi:hypothetical protein